MACTRMATRVHREGEDVIVPSKDRRRAVALVDVQVDDGDALYVGVRAHPARGDGEIVQDGETGPEIAMSVVRAACEVRRKTMPQRQLRSEHGAGALEPCAVDERLRAHLVAESDAALLRSA